MSPPTPRIVVCLKWVAHPGEPHDERFAGMSPADQAALELALLQGESYETGITAITVGPAGADKVLRDALAAGARRVVRVDAPTNVLSADVAAAIAATVPDATWVWCGDYSLDRGTGSVPAFLAGQLLARQALGVIDVTFGGDVVNATRRLDGGRREMLHVTAPAVVSVEGATAHMRRAGLGALRAAGRTPVEVVSPSTPIDVEHAVVRPYRPRARALSAPAGQSALDRLRVLTDSSTASAVRGETVELEPAAAAARIVSALRDWGYLS